MSRQSWWLLLVGLLFLAWSVWLGGQALEHSRPTIVSQSQLLIAPIVVAAQVTATPANGPALATCTQVLRGEGFLPTNRQIKILDWNLASGANGPGEYLLALQSVDKAEAKYLLVPIPVSPGFFYREGQNAQRPVYPLTDSTLLQAREILSRLPAQ